MGSSSLIGNSSARVLVLMLPLLAGATSVAAEPGQYWEITTRTEMPNMPMAMPAQTNKVCSPTHPGKDPGAASQNNDCQITDVKTSGNKTTWKMRCNSHGTEMSGNGEMTASESAFNGVAHFSGKGDNGMPIQGTFYTSGKKLGGSCDTNAAVVAAPVAAANGRMCDLKRFERDNAGGSTQGTLNLIKSSGIYLGSNANCKGMEKEVCAIIKRDAAKDPEVFQALIDQDQSVNSSDQSAVAQQSIIAQYSGSFLGGLAGSDVAVAEVCGIDIESAKKAQCAAQKKEGDKLMAAVQKGGSYNGDFEFDSFQRLCPAEAKAMRDQNRAFCEGKLHARTAQEWNQCLSGNATSPFDSAGRSYTAPASGRSYTAAPSSDSGSGSGVGGVIDNAIKLKGLFGF